MAPTLRPRNPQGRAIHPNRASDASTPRGTIVSPAASSGSTETETAAASAAPTPSSSSSSVHRRGRRSRRDYEYVPKSFYVRPDPKLLPPQPLMMERRQFAKACVAQTHPRLPTAVAHALAIPEVLGLIGQQLAETIAETSSSSTSKQTKYMNVLARCTLAALVRTCQAWYTAFVPWLYRDYVIQNRKEDPAAFVGLERYAHLIERLTIRTPNAKMTHLALARIHASCVVREYLLGKLAWPGLEEEEEEKEGESKEQDKENKQENQEMDLDAGEPQEQTQEQQGAEKKPASECGVTAVAVVRTRSDLDKMTPNELMAYVEEHPLSNVKVGRMQYLDVREASVDGRELASKKVGIFLRSFPLTSLVMHQFSNCAWLTTETTALSWWSRHFPALESIIFESPHHESPLTLFQVAVFCPNLRTLRLIEDRQRQIRVNRDHIFVPMFKQVLQEYGQLQQDSFTSSPKLKEVHLPFQFLLPDGAPRVRRSDGKGDEVSVGVYFFFARVGRNIEHLVLTNIGNSGPVGAPTPNRRMRAEDWTFIATQVPNLRTLHLAVPMVTQAHMWATTLAVFREHCPHLHSLTFDGQPALQRPIVAGTTSYEPLEDMTMPESALLDSDIQVFAAGGQDGDRAMDQAVKEEKKEEEEEEEEQVLGEVENKVVSLVKPAPVTGWCSVLSRLKLRGCLYIKAEGVLAVLENCDRLEALDVRETRVATIELFTATSATTTNTNLAITAQDGFPRWACADSLVALGLDFGRFDKGPSWGYGNREDHERRRQRRAARQQELDVWHGGEYPSKFSTFELLQIRRRLLGLSKLQILHLGGPQMGFKIIARLEDLKASTFVGGSEDAHLQEALRAMEERGGREVDSLLEHVSYFQVHVSLIHVAKNATKHWTWLGSWLLKLRGGRQIMGSADHEESVPIFSLLRSHMDRSLAQLPANHPKVVHFKELAAFVAG